MSVVFDTSSGEPFYCVIGSPISHSLSPVIHAAFAEANHIRLHYDRVEVQPSELAEALKAFIACDGRGMNVTLPLKELVFPLADEVRPRAELAGAANTLIVEGGRSIADNTDGVGLVRDLTQNLKCNLERSRILVLGAGGATRGVIPSLLETKPAGITIANRTIEKAQAIVTVLKSPIIEACGFSDLNGKGFDVIINATSLGVDGKVPPISDTLLSDRTFCYDMMYDVSKPTSFLAWCAAHSSAALSDGLGMLVEQAAESFYLWHGLRPATAPIIKMLRGN